MWRRRKIELLDFRACDGSRQFATLPQSELWYAVRDHVAKLPGAKLTRFLCDNVTEAWIDFEYSGYRFTVNDQLAEYWFFSNDPRCPDEILEHVVDHFRKLLGG